MHSFLKIILELSRRKLRVEKLFSMSSRRITKVKVSSPKIIHMEAYAELTKEYPALLSGSSKTILSISGSQALRIYKYK